LRSTNLRRPQMIRVTTYGSQRMAPLWYHYRFPHAQSVTAGST